MNIFVRFDGKTATKMNESENVLNVDNPYVLERPLIRQFLSKSWNSCVFPMLKLEKQNIYKKVLKWFMVPHFE